MNNNELFFAIILFFITFLWASIAFIIGKSIKNLSDYFLADTSLTTMPLTLTLLATQVGAHFLSGIAQQAYFLGYYALFYALGISSGFLFLSLGIAERLRFLSIKTTADLFETVYNSIFLKKIASLFSIISLWGILIVQLVTLNSIILTLGILDESILIIFWLAIIITTVHGGLSSIVAIDIFKQLLIITTFVMIFLYSFITKIHTFSHVSHIINIQSLFNAEQLSWYYLLPSCILLSLFCLIQQDITQCFFAAKNPQIAKYSARLATLFLLFLCWMPVYFGIQAKLFTTTSAVTINPLALFLQNIDNELFFIVLIIALIAAVTSTASALICAISSHIVQDFFPSSFLLSRAKMITCAVGVVSLLTSLVIPAPLLPFIADFYEIYVGLFFVSTFYSYFCAATPSFTAWCSIIGGIVGLSITFIFSLSHLAKLLPLLFSCTGFLIGKTVQISTR